MQGRAKQLDVVLAKVAVDFAAIGTIGAINANLDPAIVE